MDLIDRYKDDFEEIVELVWRAHLHGKRKASAYTDTLQLQLTSTYAHVLRKELLNINNACWSTFSVEREDISQELSYLWLKYHKKWKTLKKRRTSLRDYLLSCSVWGMKSWYRSQVIGMSHNPVIIYHSSEEMTGSCSEDLWTLENLLSTRMMIPFPLSQLRPYERYLIFLKYKMEKNTVEIAYIVQKDRGVVARQLEEIHTKLRSLADETQDPR